MDALTEVLDTLNLESSAYCRITLGAPWRLAMPGTSRMTFHAIGEGGAWLRTATQRDPLRLESGDFVVITDPHGHELASAPSDFDRAPIPLRKPDASCPHVEHTGTGVNTSMVCGYFQLDALGGAAHPLQRLLPTVIQLRAGDACRPTLSAATLDLLHTEAGSCRAGSAVIVRRLTDVLFVQMLRAWLEREHEDASPGWLGALRDPGVGAALLRMHDDPAYPWTVADLAREADLSRSTFAVRFRRLTGETPLTYLTRWRILLASRLLRDGVRVGDVASRVGYATEAAFSAAFKRERGISPGSYRRADAARVPTESRRHSNLSVAADRSPVHHPNG